jgi:ATP-dependent RNA helicase DDX24/MAK5
MLVRNIGVKEKVEKVDLTRRKGTATLLTETYFLCNVEDKDLYLYYMLLNHPGKTLVFANSIDGVMNLVSYCSGYMVDENSAFFG